MIHGVKLFADPCDLLKLATKSSAGPPAREFVEDVAANGVKEAISVKISINPEGIETWTVEDGVKRIMAAIVNGQKYVPITETVEVCQ